ncbi:ERBB receptor feedback inhibitor 1a [Thalassophryne amazonica]|uniref:ERBB receptor feedback inhibitor 1a n=1 Tax=Thalassophryne amazonica TaxID=390379 RepID=UPI0014722C25|nr:ERBB receptor feedback inhibitor 1a [Thalassophryne amazonica]XP_034022130.1 ERBB receptor feedback inhibitor 1a [Thalassophryne amazonica]
MRPEGTWSMSTVGLTAQEIAFPIENPFLRGSYCNSMAGSKPFWALRHELDNVYFCMDTACMDHSSRAQQQGLPPSYQSYEKKKHSPSTQRLPPKKSRPSHLSLSFRTEPSTTSPADDDQVVPSFQRLSVYECSSPPQTPGRCSKPLPPIPPQMDLSPDQAMDNEVKFFTSSDESCCLVSDQYPKSSPFRYGISSRRSFRDCGQINYAYYDGPLPPPNPHQHKPQPLQEVQEQQEPQRQESEPLICHRLQDRGQRRLRRSHSGPAGSLNKPTLLRPTCHKHHTQSMDKPEVPPPIPPRTVKTVDYRRWSAEVSSGAFSDEDKPPKVPPREPLSQSSSRTPSPKSLPTYINGVMPPTQSFAPDPKYVSCRGLPRQYGECAPCILPIIENGKKVSNTHYFLLPQRPAVADTAGEEKYLQVPDSPTVCEPEVSDLVWDCHTRRKAHVSFV